MTLTQNRLAMLKQSPRSANVTDVEDLCEEVERLRTRVSQLADHDFCEFEEPEHAADEHDMRNGRVCVQCWNKCAMRLHNIIPALGQLRAAAYAVVQMWETPNGKDSVALNHYMDGLSEGLKATKDCTYKITTPRKFLTKETP